MGTPTFCSLVLSLQVCLSLKDRVIRLYLLRGAIKNYGYILKPPQMAFKNLGSLSHHLQDEGFEPLGYKDS